MQDYYRDEYGAESTYIPYSGAVGDDPDAGALARFGIQPGNYYLVVARMEPENNVDLIIRKYRASGLGRPLIVVGSVPYDSDYARAVAAQDDGQVHCVGGVFESAALNALYRHCAAYLHGHEVGGTNPGLLRAMHWGAPCLPVNVAFHRETMGENNPRFDTTPGHLAARAALRAFAARLETDRPDIVHSHELYPLISPGCSNYARGRACPSCTAVMISASPAPSPRIMTDRRRAPAARMGRITHCCATAGTTASKAPPSPCAMRSRSGAISTAAM